MPNRLRRPEPWRRRVRLALSVIAPVLAGCAAAHLPEDCQVGGALHPSGTSFPSEDGCNTCHCDDGSVACTERACLPQPDPECRVDGDCPPPPCPCLDRDGDGSCENVCPVPRCRGGRCTLEDPPQPLGLGDSCGGFGLSPQPLCDAGLFCQHQPGALCGAADAPGECVTVPDLCPEIFDPVCGCDGKTYSSACHAAMARAGILETGECGR